jgi:phage gpG-like protein
MLLNISVEGDKKLIARLDGLPQKMHDAILKKVTGLNLLLEIKAKGKLSDDVLHVKTGALRRSIFGTIEDSGKSIVGMVASSGDVKYAAIQEFGGKTAAHDIFPDKAKSLAFVLGGKEAFFKVVHHPGSQIPERSYLRSSLEDMSAQIIFGLKEAVAEGLK